MQQCSSVTGKESHEMTENKVQMFLIFLMAAITAITK